MPEGNDEQETTLPRDAAREKAAVIRQQHRKQERRRRLYIGGGIGIVLVAIVAAVTVSILSAVRPPSAGPMNMLSDGVQIGIGLAATQTSPLQPGATPVPNSPNPASGAVEIRIYQDYLCSDCGAFQRANSAQLRTWVNDGAATLEVHPIALLDSRSQGSEYSTRAANAVACVANFEVNRFLDVNDALFEDQPAESTAGLTDDELIDRVADAGVTENRSVNRCIRAERFRPWVREATDRALAGPLPGTELPAVSETPTILVNGLQFRGPFDDPTAFSQFIVQAAGASFTESSSATPGAPATPSPTGTSPSGTTPPTAGPTASPTPSD